MPRVYKDVDNGRVWYYTIDANINKKVKTIYQNVKHLENMKGLVSELLPTKIAMALIRAEGKEIENLLFIE